MARFFIDTSDGDAFVRDEQGALYLDIEDAKAAAVAVLPDMARDKLPDGDNRRFLSVVRNEEGRTLIHASLSLEVSTFPL